MDNIILDFTKTSIQATVDAQPKAIMSATMAKKLLRSYAEQLSSTSASRIIDKHINNIRACTTVDEAVSVSVDWIGERELITNITNNEWDAYEVENPIIASL